MRTALALVLCLCSYVAAQTFTFSGKVVDIDGKAVEGAKVYLVIWTWQPRRLEPLIKQTQSASDGSFAFPNLKPLREGQYASVIAIKEGYGAWGVSIGPKMKTTDLEICLPRSGEIVGQVVDKKGKPIAKVKVRVIDVSTRERDGLWEGWSVPEKLNILSTQTDAAGKFRIELLPEGATVRLSIRHPRYAQWEIGNIAVGKKDIKVSLPLAAKIIGRVVFEKTKNRQQASRSHAFRNGSQG